MRCFSVLALLVPVMLLSGCEGAGLVFEEVQPLKNEAVIYVSRDDPYAGAGALDILVDQQSIGRLPSSGYVYKVVPPGRHVVRCATETQSELAIDAVAGNVYYVQGEMMTGSGAGRSRLSLLPQDMGKAMVAAHIEATTSDTAAVVTAGVLPAGETGGSNGDQHPREANKAK